MTFSGLSEREAEAARQKYGLNERKHEVSFVSKLLNGIFGLSCKLMVIAVLAEIIAILLGMLEIIPVRDSFIKLFVLIGAAILCAFIETLIGYNAEKTLNKLCNSASSRTYTVFRDMGKTETVAENMLTVGDAVYISYGDVIPADGRMVDGAITVDQSVFGVLGKSEKTFPPSDYNINKASGLNNPYCVHCGTSVCGGSGIFIITAIGSNTKIAEKLGDKGAVKIHGSKLGKLSQAVAVAGIFAASAVMLISIIGAVSGSILSGAVNGISAAAFVLAVSAFARKNLVCENTAASAVKKLKGKNVDVSVPDMLNDVCESKIIFTGEKGVFTKDNCAVSGFIDGNGTEFGNYSDIEPKLGNLLRAAVAATSNAYISADGSVFGNDSAGKAALSFVKGKSVRNANLKKQGEVIAEGDYELSGATVSFDGKLITFIRGGAEILLERCSDTFLPDGRKQKITNKNALIKLAATISLTGNSVIAFAITDHGIKGKRLPEGGCTLIGLMVLHDSLYDDVEETVSRLEGLGIQTVLVTESSRETAIFTVKRAKLNGGKGVILSSEQLAKMSDSELSNRLSDIRAVVRARPSDKRRLLIAARENGVKSCMIGTVHTDTKIFDEADTFVASTAADSVVQSFSAATLNGCGIKAAADLISCSAKFVSGYRTAHIIRIICTAVSALASIYFILRR